MKAAVWSVSASPTRLVHATDHTEADLESWVLANPDIVRDGLTVVAQQLVMPDRGRLDLLCIDRQQRWVLIELKRGRADRDVVAQVIDYMSYLATLPRSDLERRLAGQTRLTDGATKALVAALLRSESDDSGRDITAIVVGSDADVATIRMADYLANKHDIPISVVTLQTFRTASGERIIVREDIGELIEPAEPSGGGSLENRWSNVLQRAADAGAADAMTSFRKEVETAGLFARPYKRAIMVTPADARHRYLAVVQFRDRAIWISYGVDAFQEFFPQLRREEIERVLGEEAARRVDVAGFIAFGEALSTLMTNSPASPAARSD